MRALGLLAMLIALTTLPACSFLGLDNIPVEGCTNDAECTDLAEEELPPDDCHSWQCSPVSMRCELDVLDDDGDGAPRMLSPSMATCAMGASVDCNDDPSDPAAATTRPGAEEVCNGLDNDCDGFVDEDAIDVSETCEAATAARELSVGTARVGGFAVAEALYTTATGVVHVSFPAEGEPVTGAVTATPAMRMSDALFGLSLVRAGEWAVLRSTGGTCSSPFVQRFRVASGTIEGDRAGAALPLPEEVCVTSSRSAERPPGSGTMVDLAITQLGAIAADATGDGDGVVAYVEEGALTSCTGGTASPQMLEAYAAIARFPAAGDYTVETTPVSLGQHAGRGAPALLAVSDDLYLAALPRPDGTVEVLEIDTSGAAPVATSVYVEAGTAPADNVSLTAGEDGRYALSFDFVCAAGVRTRLFDWTPGGSATARQLLSDERPALFRPIAIHQPALDEWLVTYTTGAVVQGSRFDASGNPIGEPAQLATSHDNSTIAAQALDTGRAYRVFALRDPAPMPPTDVPMCPAAITLGCLPPG